MNERLSILLVEDDDYDGQNVLRELEQVAGSDVVVEWKRDLNAAVEATKASEFDAMILDLGLPDRSGKESLVFARAGAPHLPIVVLTGATDHALALWSLKHGAQEYLVKEEVNGRSLHRCLRYAVERSRMLARIEEYAREARLAQTRMQQGLLEVQRTLDDLVERAEPAIRDELNAVRTRVEDLVRPSETFRG